MAIKLETFLKMPPPLSIMARVLVWLLYVRVLTKNAKAPGTVQISALFSVQCADKFQRALKTLFNVDSCKISKNISLMTERLVCIRTTEVIKEFQRYLTF